MAIPHIKGMNPDYTGIPFSSDASKIVFHAINDNNQEVTKPAAQAVLAL